MNTLLLSEIFFYIKLLLSASPEIVLNMSAPEVKVFEPAFTGRALPRLIPHYRKAAFSQVAALRDENRLRGKAVQLRPAFVLALPLKKKFRFSRAANQ